MAESASAALLQCCGALDSGGRLCSKGGGALQVFVRVALPGQDAQQLCVEVEPDATVADLLKEISSQTGALRDGAQLRFQGELLSSGAAALADLGIGQQAVLELCNPWRRFELEQKLEAIDRQYPQLRAPATVADVGVDPDGMQVILVHFDGWTDRYDYWCSADSPDIAPCGTCQRLDCQLYPPKGDSLFCGWEDYLQRKGAKAAPEEAFIHIREGGQPFAGRELPGIKYQWSTPACPATRRLHIAAEGTPTADGLSVLLQGAPCSATPGCSSQFRVGHRLEAVDRTAPGTPFAAAAVFGMRPGAPGQPDQLLIGFQGRGPQAQYWVPADSTDIAPCCTCERMGLPLIPPHATSPRPDFNWRRHLTQNGCAAAPDSAFQTSVPHFSTQRHAAPEKPSKGCCVS
eukprot:TRINITY_DN31982_c0_g1_i1.p1 TRINITY_DN31982_c0_g1~~TRINITY_DN31982_c0_g1_i1.p1  ORF type:complete len:425 (+),score=91.41 TRINITY_DN31982_c0_g1_i1:68-1276(+)